MGDLHWRSGGHVGCTWVARGLHVGRNTVGTVLGSGLLIINRIYYAI